MTALREAGIFAVISSWPLSFLKATSVGWRLSSTPARCAIAYSQAIPSDPNTLKSLGFQVIAIPSGSCTDPPNPTQLWAKMWASPSRDVGIMIRDAEIRKAKPKDQPYRIADAGGLFLYVTPAGGKHWRMRYRFVGKEKTLTFGPYPQVSLAEAREARDAAKAVLREGLDPAVVKRHEQQALQTDTFENLAREWHERTTPKWKPRHAWDVLNSLERDVFPHLGSMPIKKITPPDVLAVLRMIEDRGAIETAHKVRQRMSSVFVYAIATGRGEGDPAAIVQKALRPVANKGRQPALTELDQVRKLLKDVEAEHCYPVTKLAVRFLALTVVRPGELRHMRWEEVAGDCWIVPAERMKMKREHIVPLTRQAQEVLKALRTLTGGLPYAFANSRHAHKPMSENAMGYLINRAGYHHRHVPHGWRATFSTIMNEKYPDLYRVIDAQLAHKVKDEVEGAYNRAAYLQRRRELLQEWADMLLEGFCHPSALVDMPRRVFRMAPHCVV